MDGLMFYLSVLSFLLILQQFYTESAAPGNAIHYLEPGTVIENKKDGLQIYCHNAKSKYLINMWKSLTICPVAYLCGISSYGHVFQININTQLDTYDIYDGKSPQEVIQKHDDNQRSWRFNLFGAKKNRRSNINPFENSCIGIYVYPSTELTYTLEMTQTRADISQILMMLTGAIVYWSAQKFSRNPLFYYICGVLLGVTTSILILLYFVSKFLPRGKTMYLVFAVGWTFYLAQVLWDNAQLILIQYRELVMWYILISSLISFIICYRFGPVTNVRTKKIIQWFLQIAGLIAMYYSSYFREASFSCCVLLVLLYNFPIMLIRKGRSYWKNIFPERRKLLNEDQYRQEGVRETKKALKELQAYCSSPECKPWRIILKLKDPIRFAKFMDGESHLSDDETREHDAEITKIIEEYEYTDDEDYL